MENIHAWRQAAPDPLQSTKPIPSSIRIPEAGTAAPSEVEMVKYMKHESELQQMSIIQSKYGT